MEPYRDLTQESASRGEVIAKATQPIKALYSRQGALVYMAGLGLVYKDESGKDCLVESPGVHKITESIRLDGTLWFKVWNQGGECWREINANSVSEVDYFTEAEQKDAAENVE